MRHSPDYLDNSDILYVTHKFPQDKIYNQQKPITNHARSPTFVSSYSFRDLSLNYDEILFTFLFQKKTRNKKKIEKKTHATIVEIRRPPK